VKHPLCCDDHLNPPNTEAYLKELQTEKLIGSMGRQGNPYDNAKAESFMKTLKGRSRLPDGFRKLRGHRRAPSARSTTNAGFIRRLAI
jgi:transposase InsO family protein